jgi:hypothetical protein
LLLCSHSEAHSSESREIPARNRCPLPAARQLAQEQLVFECGPKRAGLGSVERDGDYDLYGDPDLTSQEILLAIQNVDVLIGGFAADRNVDGRAMMAVSHATYLVAKAAGTTPPRPTQH